MVCTCVQCTVQRTTISDKLNATLTNDWLDQYVCECMKVCSSNITKQQQYCFAYNKE